MADLSNPSADTPDAIADAITLLRTSGEITLDVEARINREWGRELTVTASDRGHAMIGIFFFNYNLYHLRANLAPGGADGNADAVRSQQSLRVIGGRNGGGNRPGGRPGRGFGRRGAFVLRAFS